MTDDCYLLGGPMHAHDSTDPNCDRYLRGVMTPAIVGVMTPEELQKRVRDEHHVSIGSWGDWQCSCGKGNSYLNADLSGKTPRGVSMHLKAVAARIWAEGKAS